MTDPVREKAVNAADMLNDLIGDLIGRAMLLREWDAQFKAGRVPEMLMVNVQKICVSHLALSLCKFVEFHKRFHQAIPSMHRETCRNPLRDVNRRGVIEFRNKCVGHILDTDQQRPLIHSEIMARLGRMTGGDMSGFLNWISNPKGNEYPLTSISVIQTVRDALISDHSIKLDEIIQR